MGKDKIDRVVYSRYWFEAGVKTFNTWATAYMDKCGVSRIQVGHIVFYNNMGWVHIFLMKKADASCTESDERKELSLEIPNRMIFLQKFQISKVWEHP